VTPNAATKEYGAADPALTGTLTGFLTADGVTASYSRTAGETVLGGPYTISATLSPAAALSNYSITYNTASFTITARDASVTPNAASKTYGDADPVFTGTLTGFVAADGVTATYSRTAGETVAGGPYTISATLSPAGVLSNYSITYNTANFTINLRNATWTTNANSKTYGDSDPVPVTTGSGSNFVDPVTATYARVVGETVTGGPYHITATLNAGAGVLDNYNITNDGADFTIDPKAASVTPNAASKIYGAADPALIGTLSGFLAADSVTATYSRIAGETVAGSPYTISATLSPAGVLSNYNITYTTANFAITPKAASVTPNAASKIYGNADPALTGTLSGFLAADSVTATYSRAPGETVAGSPYTISATLSPAGVLGNYSITYNTANFTISVRALDITANNLSKTYGNAFTFAGTEFTSGAGQLVAGDSVTSVSLTSAGAAATATVTAPGPTYAITASAAVGTGLANYSITYHSGTLTVNPRQLDITANNRTKTYGVTVTFAGTEFNTGTGQLVNGNTVTGVTLTSAGAAMTATVTAPGPDYSIVPTSAVGTGLGNYTISYINGTLHINTAPLTITATNRSKVFGVTYTPVTTNPSPDFTVGALVNGNTVTSITLTCAGYAAGATVVGSPYTITASAAMGTGLGNYTISYMPGTFTVSTWTITGFYQPVDMGGVVNTVKGGSTVPLKFNIYAGGVERTSVSDVMYGTVQVAEYGCSGGPEDPMGDLPNTGATALRYDTTGHQFIQNWATPKAPNKCYRVRMTAADGSIIEALFKTK
jgi:MBG domain (YGX type)